jgi:hypothetical protein
VRYLIIFCFLVLSLETRASCDFFDPRKVENKQLCKALKWSLKNPGLFGKIGSQLRSSYLKNSQLWNDFLLPCAAFVGARLAHGEFKDHRILSRLSNNKDFVSEHGSNAIYGTTLLSAAHCFGNLGAKALVGKKVKGKLIWTLRIAAAGSLVGHTWEEIDLPIPEEWGEQRSLRPFNSAGEEVQTDLTDFGMGAGATLLYLAFFEFINRKSAPDLAELHQSVCK